MFQALVIDWLQVASISAVADRIGLSWNAVDGIIQRAVKRGFSRREALSPTRINVDETAYRKGNDYVTDQAQGALACQKKHPPNNTILHNTILLT